MRLLMFSIVQELARDLGCSDETWELVLEFAEPGVPPMKSTDAAVLETFGIPIEAMCNCLLREKRDA